MAGSWWSELGWAAHAQLSAPRSPMSFKRTGLEHVLLSQPMGELKTLLASLFGPFEKFELRSSRARSV